MASDDKDKKTRCLLLLSDYAYTNSRGVDKKKLRELLKDIPAAIKFDLLTTATVSHKADQAVYTAALFSDKMTLVCLFNGLTSIQNNILHQHMPLLKAAAENAEILQYLLDNLNADQHFSLLSEHDSFMCTPLHYAVYANKIESIKAILCSVTQHQQRALLNMKDGFSETVFDMLPDTFQIELSEVFDSVGEL